MRGLKYAVSLALIIGVVSAVTKNTVMSKDNIKCEEVTAGDIIVICGSCQTYTLYTNITTDSSGGYGNYTANCTRCTDAKKTGSPNATVLAVSGQAWLLNIGDSCRSYILAGAAAVILIHMA